MTWRSSGPIWSEGAGEGGVGLVSPPSGLGWAGLSQCVRACGLVSTGKNSSRGLHSGVGQLGPGVSGVCAACVCGQPGGVGVPWGVGLLAAGVCGLPSVGGGERCSAGGSMAGVCGCLGGWERPVSRGLGLQAMVGVCGPPGGEWGGRGKDGGRVGGCGAWVACVVSVYSSACSDAPVWSLVGRAVWRRRLPSSAGAARILQMSVRIWCTSWSVRGKGFCSAGLRCMRRGIVWMAWYAQVRGCCGLKGGVCPRVWACLDLCVGGWDGPDPGQGPH